MGDYSSTDEDVYCYRSMHLTSTTLQTKDRQTTTPLCDPPWSVPTGDAWPTCQRQTRPPPTEIVRGNSVVT